MTNSNLLNQIQSPESGSYDNAVEFAGTVGLTGDVTIGSSATASDITFVAAASTANVCDVTITINDASGSLVAGVQNLKLWLSDAATGAGQSGTTASGTVTNKTASGTVLDTLTAKQSLIVQTLSTGVFILEITDTAKTGFYICVENPFTGKTHVSDQLVTGDYGA